MKWANLETSQIVKRYKKFAIFQKITFYLTYFQTENKCYTTNKCLCECRSTNTNLNEHSIA